MEKDLILIGMPGCGKSTLGKRLAKRLGREFLDLDTAIEDEAKKTIPQIFEEEGEGRFRHRETQVFHKALGFGRVIATGGGIVTQAENASIAKGGVVIFIDRPLANIIGDVKTDTRPLLAKGKERLKRLYEERYSLYRNWADVHIINDTTCEETLEKIIKEVKEYENHGN